MDKDDLKKIYIAEPFKTRNAEKYDSSSIWNLFIESKGNDCDPFKINNLIIKGEKGSGKTMFLRINYEYFLRNIDTGVLPVYINMSDFQDISEPEQIYQEVIIRIAKEIVELIKIYTDKGYLKKENEKLDIISNLIEKLTFRECTQSISRSDNRRGGVTIPWMSAGVDYSESTTTEIKHINKPRIDLLDDIDKKILQPYDRKMLILLDEVEVVNKRFFSGSLEGSSYFETLIHQLSNKTYAIIKIAIYPYSFEDIFKERGSRYGDIVKLGKNVMLNPEQYNTTIDEISWLIEKYINQVSNIRCNVQDVFEVSDDDKLLIEHLVNAANGNMRRLVELIASSMDIASNRHKGEGRVTIEDVLTALKKQGEGMEEGLSGWEIEKLEMLVRQCCSAKTNKFIFSQAM